MKINLYIFYWQNIEALGIKFQPQRIHVDVSEMNALRNEMIIS